MRFLGGGKKSSSQPQQQQQQQPQSQEGDHHQEDRTRFLAGGGGGDVAGSGRRLPIPPAANTGTTSRSSPPLHHHDPLLHETARPDSQMRMRMDEAAEDSILSNLEAQASRTRPLSDGFRPALRGERVPLGVESLGHALVSLVVPHHDDDNDTPTTRARTFHHMARTVQHVNRFKQSSPPNTTPITHGGGAGATTTGGTRKAQTLLASIDQHQQQMGTNDRTPRRTTTNEGLDYLWKQDDDDKDDDDDEGESPFTTNTTNNNNNGMLLDAPTTGHNHTSPERRPLLGRSGAGSGAIGDNTNNSNNDSVGAERRQQAQRRARYHRCKRFLNCLWNPVAGLRSVLSTLLHSTLVVSIPCFVTAWVLFYYMGNPKFDFMPGTATLSWWLNFVGRQLLVLELARMTEFIFIDVLIMSSKTVVQMLGPWVTIFCLQSKGWPFLITYWGLYDMLLLHGDNNFQQHWLYWTGIEIYSHAADDSTGGGGGGYILTSSVYLRVLIGMELAGMATTLKRTLLTLYFGKRNFDIYKPKLEEILHDIIVITEIAELGVEADVSFPDDEGGEPMEATDLIELQQQQQARFDAPRSRAGRVRWSSVKFNETGPLEGIEDVDELDSPAMTDTHFEVEGDEKNRRAEDSPMMRSRRTLPPQKSGSSGVIKIKNLLDRWEEPVNKLDKTTECSVSDILKFRKALTYMDLEHPFGEAFGPASTRDELIKSAQVLYQRLLKLSPGSHQLPYSVLSVLNENSDGSIDISMKKSLSNLFRADAHGEIPMLAFIQNCDVVYRRLRYFRASVGNASVIDKVLENIIDCFFVFGLTLMILSLLNFDPWPLLVSVSTLLVSFAFAIGPTAAKSIEGIILIAGTRPFDIGDRIIIANSPGQPSAGVLDSWFVEDITLFSTTLRLAANNEVATVSNGTISGTRITNCARSKNAVVSIIMKLHISLHDGNNAHMFKDAVENYISDNPAVWDSLVYLRCEDINSDDEYVMYHLAVRSRHSWQVAARILSERGRLHHFCTDLAKQLEVNFDSPTSRRVFYYGGNLVDGAVKDFKKNLLMDRNNISMGGPDAFLASGGNSNRGASATGAAPHESTIEEADGEGTMPCSDNAADDIVLAMVNQSRE